MNVTDKIMSLLRWCDCGDSESQERGLFAVSSVSLQIEYRQQQTPSALSLMITREIKNAVIIVIYIRSLMQQAGHARHKVLVRLSRGHWKVFLRAMLQKFFNFRSRCFCYFNHFSIHWSPKMSKLYILIIFPYTFHIDSDKHLDGMVLPGDPVNPTN